MLCAMQAAREGSERYFARSVGQRVYSNFYGVGGKKVFNKLRPFDKACTAAVEVILIAEVVHFVYLFIR